MFLAGSVSLGSGSEVFIADGFLSCVGDFVAGRKGLSLKLRPRRPGKLKRRIFGLVLHVLTLTLPWLPSSTDHFGHVRSLGSSQNKSTCDLRRNFLVRERRDENGVADERDN